MSKIFLCDITNIVRSAQHNLEMAQLGQSLLLCFAFHLSLEYCLPDKNVHFGNTSKYKCFANLQLIVNIHHSQIFGNWRLFFGLKRLCPQRRIRDTSHLIYEKYSLIQNYSFIQNYFTIAILNKRIL